MMKDIYLADLLVEAGAHAEEPWKSMIRVVGSRLVINPRKGQEFVKRFIFDEKTQEVLDRFKDISFEEFIDQIDHILMPFDRFWIESTLPESEKRLPNIVLRSGFLLSKRGDEILGQFAFEYRLPEEPKKSRQSIIDTGQYIRDDHYVIVPDVEIIFNRKGIYWLGEGSIYFSSASREQRQKEVLQQIEFGKEIYRMLILISSRHVHTNLVPGPPLPDDEVLPPGSLHPIRIDLSKELQQALIDKINKKITILLGWTDVMRHRRTYHTLEGPEKRVIQPHDRRIKPPIDRRKVPRVLTASDVNIDIELTDDGPHLVAGKKRKKKSEQQKRSGTEATAASVDPSFGSPKNPINPVNLFKRILRRFHF